MVTGRWKLTHLMDKILENRQLLQLDSRHIIHIMPYLLTVTNRVYPQPSIFGSSKLVVPAEWRRVALCQETSQGWLPVEVGWLGMVGMMLDVEAKNCHEASCYVYTLRTAYTLWTWHDWQIWRCICICIYIYTQYMYTYVCIYTNVRYTLFTT